MRAEISERQSKEVGLTASGHPLLQPTASGGHLVLLIDGMMDHTVTCGNQLQRADDANSMLTLALLLGLLGGSVGQGGISASIHGLVGAEYGGQ